MYYDSSCYIKFIRSDGCVGEDNRYYSILLGQNLLNGEWGNCDIKCSESNGKFIMTVEQYNIYADFDEYIVTDWDFTVEKSDTGE